MEKTNQKGKKIMDTDIMINKEGDINCSIFITDISLDNFAREMKRLSEKYKDYKITIAEIELDPMRFGKKLLFNITRKEKK